MEINIEVIEAEIAKLQKVKRKMRKDKGLKRTKYSVSDNPKYVSYLKRANSKGIQFELTEQHFNELDSCTCQYCGDSASGFDRVDSKQGYTLNNVVPCCGTCNMMKFTLSTNQFYKHIEKIYCHINSD